MSIQAVISKYSGVTHDANDFWPDGAIDPNEMIVELPWESGAYGFMADMNAQLDEHNPIQYISDDLLNKRRFFLYYANAVI
jgi:hypothetical protein